MAEVGGNAAAYLADPADITLGAAAIERILAQDATQRLASVRAGIENAARFSADRMIGEYLAIYHEVLEA